MDCESCGHEFKKKEELGFQDVFNALKKQITLGSDFNCPGGSCDCCALGIKNKDYVGDHSCVFTSIRKELQKAKGWDSSCQ